MLARPDWLEEPRGRDVVERRALDPVRDVLAGHVRPAVRRSTCRKGTGTPTRASTSTGGRTVLRPRAGPGAAGTLPARRCATSSRRRRDCPAGSSEVIDAPGRACTRPGCRDARSGRRRGRSWPLAGVSRGPRAGRRGRSVRAGVAVRLDRRGVGSSSNRVRRTAVRGLKSRRPRRSSNGLRSSSNSGPELAAQLVAGAGGVLADLPDRPAHPRGGGRQPLRAEDEQPGHDQHEDLPPPDAVEHASRVRRAGREPQRPARGMRPPNLGVDRSHRGLVRRQDHRDRQRAAVAHQLDRHGVAGVCSRTATTSSSAPPIGRSPTLTMTSPSTIPAPRPPARSPARSAPARRRWRRR